MNKHTQSEDQLQFVLPVATHDVPQSPEAKASLEAVFQDPTEPQWMKDRRAAEQEALDLGLTISVKKSWERAAHIQVQRISDKYPSRKRIQEFDGQ